MIRETIPNIFEIEFVLNKFPFWKSMVDAAKAAGDIVKYSIVMADDQPAVFYIKCDLFTFSCTPFEG